MVHLVEAGSLSPAIDCTYPLCDVGAALSIAERGLHLLQDSGVARAVGRQVEYVTWSGIERELRAVQCAGVRAVLE